jgi:serine/threonine-protein kinase HipA
MIGAVSVEGPGAVAAFEYTPEFAASGIEPAPLMMPLGRRIYRFPALPRETFVGLPGMLADALPDRFGNALIAQWLAEQGRTAASFDAVERLCYVGTRAMGALEFEPAGGPPDRAAMPLDVAALVSLASRVLAERTGVGGVVTDTAGEQVLSDILRVGTSAGGARAKAVVAWNPLTSELRSGQGALPAGFEPWLLKFDGVTGSGDHGLADPAGYGALEYGYALMAAAAGITMMPSRLLEEGGRRHFMTRRFDRTAEGGKLHMQSLAALAHLDFNAPASHSYEEAIAVCRALGLDIAALEELFRRMVFNVVARNQDDHVKNIAFLMDQRGRWALAPAFDLVYSWNPDGAWTHAHQMSLNGKRDDFTRDDLMAVAATASLQARRAAAIVDDVVAAVRHWPIFADQAGVAPDVRQRVAAAHRVV